MNFSSDCLIKKLLLIQDIDYHIKNGKRNWYSGYLSREMHYLSIGQELTLSPMENYYVCSSKWPETDHSETQEISCREI